MSLSPPTVVNVNPGVDETDVVLGMPIVVLFSMLMDPTTISDATFSVTGPGQTQIITPTQLIAEDARSTTGREYIEGTFAFDDTIYGGTQTQVTFTPSRPWRPNVTYKVLLIGSGAILTTDCIESAYEVEMIGSYEWCFTTGLLNLVTPPPQAPVPGLAAEINPYDIKVIPSQVTGNDLTQEIDIIFPDSVSLTPYDPTKDIIYSVDPILMDPSVRVPRGLTITPTWNTYGGCQNRRLTLSITGWPQPNPWGYPDDDF
jgi:hypothetical protein